MSSPPELELTVALTQLRAVNPALGISKLHALLLSQNPSWAVSEKRTKKILQAAGLTNNTSAATMVSTGGVVYPSSRVIESLDTKQYTAKVQVKYFDNIKGKGLVAVQPLSEGEILWKEDPFALAVEWEIYDLQRSGKACTHCSTVFSSLLSPGLTVPCSTPAVCSQRFCNRLCLTRSAGSHPLVCASQNPASQALLRFAREHQWMALNALTMVTSRVLLSNQTGGGKLDEDWAIVSGFAEMGLEERFKYNGPGQGEPDRPTWKKAHKLYLNAFKEPTDSTDRKKLSKLLKKPLPAHIDSALFEYSAFLRGLGRMSLNLEAHGGLYTLHAHLNHTCTPNVSVRHLEQRSALSRISLIARSDIAVGEELFVTYVDPGMRVRQRRERLKEWGFGICQCERCVREEKELAEEPGAEGGLGNDVSGGAVGGLDMSDLESELKAGLGVM